MSINKLKNIILTILAFFVVSASAAHAAALTLTKIGTLSTEGLDYSVVNYTGGIPVLEGSATPGASVIVRVNIVMGSTTAASPSGIWQFIPASLNTGTNNIVISSGASSSSFILNFNVPAPTATPTATVSLAPIQTLPEAGVWENIVLVVLLGVAVMFVSKYIRGEMLNWEGKKK